MTIAEIEDKIEQPRAWDLGQLLADAEDATVSERLAELSARVDAFEARRGSLAEIDREGLLELVRAYEEIFAEVHVLSGYGSLLFSSDTQGEVALAFRNRVSSALTELQNRTLFFSLWWKGLEDDEAERLLPDAASEPDRRFFLAELRRVRRHRLEEGAEKIVNLKDADGIGGLLTVYSMLTNRLSFELEEDGEIRGFTRDELMAWVMSPDPRRRETAYRKFFEVFSGEAKILSQIYVHRVRDWRNEQVGLRGYDSPISVRNVSNDVPDAAVEELLACARRNAPVFQRYFRLKARWLGVERLSRYDLYAPLERSDQTVSYGDAVRSVIETFTGFDPRFAAAARRVFADDHVDSEIRAGKRSGAFCATIVPRFSPWVLVNYAGRLRDVATLAHELGHAVHSVLAAEHSVLTQSASLPLAETASVFAEMLMTDRLLAERPGVAAQRELLSSALDDVYATVLRQSFFVLFEMEAHRAIAEGCRMEDLNRLYRANLDEQFGDSVEIADEFRLEWVSIPHFYSTPFYCYAYSFGQLLVLSLYARYRDDPEGFRPGYLRLLAHGGSARPQQILEEAGVDITDASFWQSGFDLVDGMIDRLEALESA